MILVSTISKDLYKYGFIEWPGFVSHPPKRYTNVTWSGGFRTTSIDSPNCTPGSSGGGDGSGTGVVDRFSSCDMSGSLVSVDFPSGTVSTVIPNTACSTLGNFYSSGLDGTANPFYGFGCGSGFGHMCYFSNTIAGGTAPASILCSPPSDGHDFADSSRTTLSNEYTSELLVSNAIARLPSWPSFTTGGPPEAAHVLATDELSFTVERSKYKFIFMIPKVGNGTCYKLTWVERTTLEGASPTDVGKTFTWNGVIPSGYNDETPSTYPTSGEYEIDEPASNGETIIGYYVDPLDHSSFVTNYILAECRSCA